MAKEETQLAGLFPTPLELENLETWLGSSFQVSWPGWLEAWLAGLLSLLTRLVEMAPGLADSATLITPET